MCAKAINLLIQCSNWSGQQSYTLGTMRILPPFIFKNVFYNISESQIHLYAEKKWIVQDTSDSSQFKRNNFNFTTQELASLRFLNLRV